MEANPTDKTCGSPDKPIRRARFRRGPVASQAPAETWMYGGKCKNCLEMPCRCTSVISTTTTTLSSQTQTQTPSRRSYLFGVCLNCLSDNKGPCCSCSAISATSLDQSTVMTSGGPSIRATGTPEEDEGSVYNGRKGGFTKFLKPSTTTAMNMPGAEEATVYNGKIGCSLFSGHQFGPNQTATSMATDADVRNEAIFDENIHRGGLISFGKLPSSASLAIPTTGAATEEGRTVIQRTSPIYYQTSHDRPGRSKRSWKGDTTEEGTNQSPEKHVEKHVESEDQMEAGTSVQLPAPARPSNSSCKKRRKTENKRVPAVAINSDKLQVPHDGYIWWKCGKKDIKGSPYPRSYYKCMTQSSCDARRIVMRAIDDPSMLKITYYGEHSHGPLEESATTKPTEFIEYL